MGFTAGHSPTKTLKKWSAFYLNFGYSGWDKSYQDNCRCQKFEKEQTKNMTY